MTENEKLFKNFIESIEFDDTPESGHRDRLEDDLLTALSKQPRRESTMKTWRIIMKNRTIRFATAAIVLIAAQGTRGYAATKSGYETGLMEDVSRPTDNAD